MSENAKDPRQAPDRTKSRVALPKLHPIDLDGYKLDIDYFLKTHYVSVHSANAELPAIIEWVNEQLQTAVEQKHMAKAELKQAEGNAFHDLRDEEKFRQAGFTGKLTQEAVTHAIPLMANVIEANQKYARAAGWVSRLVNTLISLQAKLDLVRTTEATRRALVESDGGGEET
jgi:hypothetical protein